VLTTTDFGKPGNDISISIGVIAWNEENAIVRMLNSLFEQSLFGELEKLNLECEILCIANGCTDATARVAAEVFARQKKRHAFRNQFVCRVADITERGKLNSWNQFVHSISAPTARFLFFTDADIVLHNPRTLWNMLVALFENRSASISVDAPRKDVCFKRKHSWLERLSLQASDITSSASAQLCAQLYCMRAPVARNIYLPKDLGACEDGFIKQLVCTDFLTQPVMPERIVLAEDAEHTFDAYISPGTIIKNQKRQIIGQTVVHLLVDKNLKNLSDGEKHDLAASISKRDRADPAWLKRLIHEHLAGIRFFWRLYPGLLFHRIRSLSKLPRVKRLKCFPAALLSFLVSLVSCWLAYRTLKSGTTNYWPKAKRDRIDSIHNQPQALIPAQPNHS
jgi:glycosyltransferase involved in cell wall biosynthesis